jgi:hypothetical protein
MRAISRRKFLDGIVICQNINFNENEQKDFVPYNNQPNELLLFEILAGGKGL